MTPRRLLVYGAIAVALVVAIFGVHRYVVTREARNSAELQQLRRALTVEQARYDADTAALRRQLRAVQPAVDSANRLRARGDSIRRRVVVVVDTTRDTVAVSDTVVVDQRIADILAADAATISQQARAIVRLEVALASDTLARQRLEAIAANQARQIAVLERMIPSRRWQTVKNVALVSGGLYAGYRVGVALGR